MILKKQVCLLPREMICLKQLPLGQNMKRVQNKQPVKPIGVQVELKRNQNDSNQVIIVWEYQNN